MAAYNTRRENTASGEPQAVATRNRKQWDGRVVLRTLYTIPCGTVARRDSREDARIVEKRCGLLEEGYGYKLAKATSASPSPNADSVKSLSKIRRQQGSWQGSWMVRIIDSFTEENLTRVGGMNTRALELNLIFL